MKTKNIYNIIKEDIKNEDYNVYPNDGNKFIAWYLINVLGLDKVEAKTCIVDGKNDKQIDAVYINDDDRIIHIIQGKFKKNSKKLDAEPLRELLFVAEKIKNDLPGLQGLANEKLKPKLYSIYLALKSGENYSVRFVLLTTIELSDAAKFDADSINNSLPENWGIDIVDKLSLLQDYEEATGKAGKPVDFSFKLERDKYLSMELAKTEVIIAAVSLSQCCDLPIDNDSLFSGNVRSYLGTTNKINKNIGKTINDESDDFFFMNNGITALCRSCKISEEDNANIKLDVKELNIINGCQTLNSIFRNSIKARESSGFVLFRFYVIPDDTERSDKISISTNNQSLIKARDLVSNNDVLVYIKNKFNKESKDYWFVTKRGEIIDDNRSKRIDINILVKVLMSWCFHKPLIAYSESTIYEKYFGFIFNNLKKDYYTTSRVESFARIYSIVESMWDKDPLAKSPLSSYKNKTIFVLIFSLSCLFCLYNGKKEMMPDIEIILKLDESILKLIINKMCVYSVIKAYKYESPEISKTPEIWLKRADSLKEIIKAIGSRIDDIRSDPDDGNNKTILAALKMDDSSFSDLWLLE